MGLKEVMLFAALIASLNGRLLAQTSANFVSLDCGLEANQKYFDSNGIEWVSDAAFIKTGKTAKVSFAPGNNPFNSLRFFDGGRSKYCYRIPDMVTGTYYLVRPRFYYGNYDGLNANITSVSFAFIVDSQSWNARADSVLELFVPARSSSISICLAAISNGALGAVAPFISSLELRPLPNDMPSVTVLQNQWASKTIHREDYGASANGLIRYSKDSLDRFWSSIFASSALQTTSPIYSFETSMVPQEVLQTAINISTITVNPPTMTLSKYFIAFYFAEISSSVLQDGDRVFDIYCGTSTVPLFSNIDIFQSVGKYYSYTLATDENPIELLGSTPFYFRQQLNSTFSPIISGLEVMQLTEKPLQLGTFHVDVTALEDVKNSLNLESWMGDPCLPIEFNWLSCTSGLNIQISALLLSNQNLKGILSPSLNSLTALETIQLNGNMLNGSIPDLSNLTTLRTLDLSNNSLTGSIPDWLTKLPNLYALSLQNNSFTGIIPKGLLTKRDAGTLIFNYDNFTGLSTQNITPEGVPEGTKQKYPSSMVITIAAVVGGLVLVAIILSVTIGVRTQCYRNCCNPNTSTNNTSVDQESNASIPIPNPMELHMSKLSIPSSSSSEITGAQVKTDLVRQFTHDEMERATKNFTTQLGKGASGIVYLGTFGEDMVAVKKLSADQHYILQMFINEVDILSKVHHANLVPLVGYCREKELMLVYTCMKNGTLRDYLYGDKKANPLGWKTRLLIALGAAEGLDYLHTKCQPRLIHRDVKSANILLDDDLRAKVSDFGISRSRPDEDNLNHHTKAMGTEGYADPEMIKTGVITEKTDVYSFGVVLLEMLCGRPPIDLSHTGKDVQIIQGVHRHVGEDNLLGVVDPWLARNQECNIRSMWIFADIALKATRKNSKKRPTMRTIVTKLHEAVQEEFGDENPNYEHPSVYNV